MSTNGLPVWKSGSLVRKDGRPKTLQNAIHLSLLPFTSRNSIHLPRQPEYPRSILALHATCAKIAQFSGALISKAVLSET
ncbi:hypothetical protein ARMGADRAFT_1082334 [Armillaria gallica]|uniref:Uncharacterized protein n=1 Tax=Armillaria gallica TaxID=47427 RepID=A0A2H3DJW3_ARMGA|nr:hypothetical protein ARMGADRAFT_1082334 [Armillaria gallica]